MKISYTYEYETKTRIYTCKHYYDSNNKEIIKVLITASRDRAKAVVYARNNTLVNILTVSVTVNDSYVDVILNPIIDLEASPAIDFSGTKVIYTAQYFHAQTPLVI